MTDQKCFKVISETPISELPTSTVRQLPCTVHFSGKADVAQKFDTYLEKNEEDQTTNAYFRGHPLIGKELNVPAGYKGVVFSLTENDEAKFLKAKSTFDSYTYYNWSTKPSVVDPQQNVDDWLEIAKAIHDN